MTLAWSLADIPDLNGKRVLVTGVTSGLGICIADELAAHGAEVVLAARNPKKVEATVARIRSRTPDAQLHALRIDLADLTSVRRAAGEAAGFGAIDVLINNAGVMATPPLRTVDGFDLQFATNHLGPFALTGLLLRQLAASGSGRVVNTGSLAHRLAWKAPLRDPRVPARHYSKWVSYAQSKLADVMFTLELDRRMKEADQPVTALAAHPGFAATGLMASGRTIGRERAGAPTRFLTASFATLGQPAHKGALPTLMASTADLPGGTYVGPGGPFEMRGDPRVVKTSRRARDVPGQQALWQLSEEATGVRYP